MPKKNLKSSLIFSFIAFSMILSADFCKREYLFAYDYEDGWHIEKSTHFIVYYKDADERFVENTIDKAEEYYKSIADTLGFTRYDFWLWEKRAKIYIYNDAVDYQTKTGKPSWSGGTAYAAEKIIETYPLREGFFQAILPHELGHIIFREFVGFQGNSPLWLDEGVAMYQERIKRTNIKGRLLNAIEQNKLIPLTKLSELNIMFVNDQELIELYYTEALSVVNFLMEQYGKGNFVELCHALKERKPFDEALNDAYRVFKNLEDLNKAWIRYIKD